MLPHHTALRLASPIAVLALTLSACGGSDDDTSTDSKKTTQPKATASPSKESSGGELATGESAAGKVKEEDGTVTYDITAEKVDLGTEAEAAKLVQDPADAKGMALAVAHVKFTHKTGPTLTTESDAGDGTTIWADGRRGALLIGASDDAPGCEDPYDVESFKAGDSHTFCESYLVPANAKSLEVHWAEEKGEPYIWKFPSQ